MLQDRKIHCLQARPCTFQPENVTGWAVKRLKKKRGKDPSGPENLENYFIGVVVGGGGGGLKGGGGC